MTNEIEAQQSFQKETYRKTLKPPFNKFPRFLLMIYLMLAILFIIPVGIYHEGFKITLMEIKKEIKTMWNVDNPDYTPEKIVYK